MITDAIGQEINVGDVVITYNKGYSGFDQPVRIIKFSDSKKSYSSSQDGEGAWSHNWEPLLKCVKVDPEVLDD
ncbi:MAG: hypothetical protein QQN63_00165 [Nitrosopumilus sp.]